MTPPRRPMPGTVKWWQSGPLGQESLPVYGTLLALLVVTALLGMRGVGVVRPLFVLGCAGVGWRALKAGPGAHVEVCIALFVFAPFLRRLVDVNAGYNPSGLMLVGPFISLAIPIWELRLLLLRRSVQSGTVYTPYLVMMACLAYSWLLSAFAGEGIEGTGNAVKTFVPIMYAMYLIQRSDVCEEVLASVIRALMVVAPIMGFYGIIQYVLLPSWDRFWMLNSTSITSIGLPEPRQVRVFSTMNSPASFAMFITCGLLFYGFRRVSLLSLAMLFPISLGLLLSLFRTNWISLVLAICFCFGFTRTRPRALALTLGLVVMGVLAIVATPFGAEIGQRLMSMFSPSHDVSSNERMREYAELYADTDHFMFGSGMTRGLTISARLIGIDGQLIASPVMMGIIVGNIHLVALVWACLQGVFSLRQDSEPVWLVAGATVVSNVLILPLSIISFGEVGFPIWTMAALLAARQQRNRSLRPSLQTNSAANPAAWPPAARAQPARVAPRAPIG